MHRQPQLNANGIGSLVETTAREILLPQATPSLKKTARSGLAPPSIEEARIASLKVLIMTLLRQVESLEMQIGDDSAPELNLQKEVQRFEAAIIRSALNKTGGRQRRAARLLGVKVTTLNTKIKRHKIDTHGDSLFAESRPQDDLLPPS